MSENHYNSEFQNLKATSLKLRALSFSEKLSGRKKKLLALEKAIGKYQNSIIEALQLDFRKPESETLLTEIYPTLKELQTYRRNLNSWMRDIIVENPLTLVGAKSYIINEAKGVCLLIGPWNYPFQLIMIPLISAIATGNTLIVKPSEFTPMINEVIQKIISEVFDKNEVLVLSGGAQTSEELLKLPFDHIFFTGSTRVGKIVMAAAAKNLTSVTLELGGKSPVIIDESCSLKTAASKLIWGKFVNAGQTCIAPDYVFVHKSIKTEFIKELKSQLTAQYGVAGTSELKDMASMISESHCLRMKKLTQQSQDFGDSSYQHGTAIANTRYFPPTLVELKNLNSPLMQEELFAPVLPLIEFSDISEPIAYIQSKDKPLAAYLFTNNKKNLARFTAEISAGGMVINDFLMHLINDELPFGGVNHSGIGRYHGYFGFNEFSHQKAVLKQSVLGRLLCLMFAPYGGLKLKLIRLLVRWKI